MINILVIEDDEPLNRMICTYLNANRYVAIKCMNPMEACDRLAVTGCNLIISDIMMPEMDGFEFAELIRKQNNKIPILFISALDDFASKQRGFRIGIDDYMVKPIDMDEMILRVGALLRRTETYNENKLQIGRLTLVRDEMSVYLDNQEIDFLPREFQVLDHLISQPKKIFTRSELIDEYSGMFSEKSLRAVDVYINKLRTKLAECKELEIVTIHGFGYKAVIHEQQEEI